MGTNQKVSPAVAGIVIALVVIVAGVFIWHSTGKRTASSETGPTIPPEVQQEFQRRRAGVTGPGSTQPSPMPPGVPTGPPGRR